MDHTMASSYFMKRISIQVDFVIITMEMEQCCGYDPYIDDIECQVFFLIPSSLSLSLSLSLLSFYTRLSHCFALCRSEGPLCQLQHYTNKHNTFTESQ